MPEVRCGISKTADKTREEGGSQVIEGPADHVRDFDIFPLGNP